MALSGAQQDSGMNMNMHSRRSHVCGGRMQGQGQLHSGAGAASKTQRCQDCRSFCVCTAVAAAPGCCWSGCSGCSILVGTQGTACAVQCRQWVLLFNLYQGLI